MTLEKYVARAFHMDDEARRRHSNPWSVYTRFTMIPLIGLAIWSRTWIHWWSLAPILAVVLWVWFNPRIFPPPQSTNNWASKAVLGEWVWMNRKSIAVPVYQRQLPNLLSIGSGLGMILFLAGLTLLHVWMTVWGGTIAILCKLWFADRMARLYEEMKDATPEYRSWLY